MCLLCALGAEWSDTWSQNGFFRCPAATCSGLWSLWTYLLVLQLLWLLYGWVAILLSPRVRQVEQHAWQWTHLTFVSLHHLIFSLCNTLLAQVQTGEEVWKQRVQTGCLCSPLSSEVKWNNKFKYHVTFHDCQHLQKENIGDSCVLLRLVFIAVNQEMNLFFQEKISDVRQNRRKRM